MKTLDYIRVVLVAPTHPGNIGAAARAMANFGLTKLYLVAPNSFPDDIANARAAGADHILDNAVVCHSLDEAIADCTMVIGTTARARSIEWPVLTPAQTMHNVRFADKQQIALLFGRERSGLTNAELERCQTLVRIPVNPDFSSLNLGSAVTVLLYELRKQVGDSPALQDIDEPLATANEVQLFYQHLHDVMNEVEFSDGRSTKLSRKLARLFSRTTLFTQEVNMLRGILTAVQKKIAKK